MWLALWHKWGSELILETTKRAIVTALSNCRHTAVTIIFSPRPNFDDNPTSKSHTLDNLQTAIITLGRHCIDKLDPA